jgi:hypothetical protein
MKNHSSHTHIAVVVASTLSILLRLIVVMIGVPRTGWLINWMAMAVIVTWFLGVSIGYSADQG